LLNSPGITSIDGVTVNGPNFFNENLPLRDGIPLTVRLTDGTTQVIQGPVINTVAGAMAIQEFFDNGLWASQAGNPVAYAPHLRKEPLAGVPAKSVIIQFGNGDQIAANPNVTAFIRAGDLADRATFYRHDLAYADIPGLPTNPHGFMVGTSPIVILPAFRPITLAAQRQIAAFFASDGRFIDDLSDITTRDGTPLFEVPIVGPLPEDLNWIPTPAPGPTPAPASGGRAAGPILTGTAGGSPPISHLSAAVHPGGTAVGPGAVIAASWASQLATLLLDEGTAVGTGATFLTHQPLPDNSLNPDPWRAKEPTLAARTSLWATRAPAFTDVFDRVFADLDREPGQMD
jgi:hypothetical protein